jgi:hypothetical protein
MTAVAFRITAQRSNVRWSRQARCGSGGSAAAFYFMRLQLNWTLGGQVRDAVGTRLESVGITRTH